jgi:hypothetical protein
MHIDELLPPAQAALIDAMIELDEIKLHWHLASADVMIAEAALATFHDPMGTEATDARLAYLHARGELAKALALWELAEAKETEARQAWKDQRGW